MVIPRIALLVVFFGCLLAGRSLVIGQKRVEPVRPSQAREAPTTCEFANGVLGSAVQAAKDDSLIILVARLGTGEKGRSLNRRRLHNARSFLTERLGDYSLPSGKLVASEGERVNGYGRVEIYVLGKFYYALKIRRNRDLFIGTCFNEGKDACEDSRQKNMYPCLDYKENR